MQLVIGLGVAGVLIGILLAAPQILLWFFWKADGKPQLSYLRKDMFTIGRFSFPPTTSRQARVLALGMGVVFVLLVLSTAWRST